LVTIAFRGQSGVEEQRRRGVASPHAHQRGEPVLGHQPNRRRSSFELRGDGHADAEGCSGCAFVAGQQRVVHIVDQSRDHDFIDRLQRYRVDRESVRGAWSGD
jgi:hypothetical protein